MIIFHRKFSIDGQPASLPGLAPRQLDRELDALLRAGRADVFRKLIWREDLIEQRSELHFSPGAAGLDVGEDALEVAHAGRKALHFAQTLVDLLQAVADQLEGLPESRFERALEFFIHGLAHLLEPLLIVRANRLQLLPDLSLQPASRLSQLFRSCSSCCPNS